MYLFIAEMRGLVNLVLLLIGINTILSLSLPVIEGDNLNNFSLEDRDAALGLPDLEMEPEFDLLNAGKEYTLVLSVVVYLCICICISVSVSLYLYLSLVSFF